MRDNLTLIRIKTSTRDAIKLLSEERDLKQVTVLEYLLDGKINISELIKYKK